MEPVLGAESRLRHKWARAGSIQGQQPTSDMMTMVMVMIALVMVMMKIMTIMKVMTSQCVCNVHCAWRIGGGLRGGQMAKWPLLASIGVYCHWYSTIVPNIVGFYHRRRAHHGISGMRPSPLKSQRISHISCFFITSAPGVISFTQPIFTQPIFTQSIFTQSIFT